MPRLPLETEHILTTNDWRPNAEAGKDFFQFGSVYAFQSNLNPASSSSIVHSPYSAMVDDVEALSLMRKCRELKERYRSDFTTQILEPTDHLDDTCVLREAEKYIVQKDQTLPRLLAEVSKYQHIHKITMEIGWKQILGPSHRPQPIHYQEHKNLSRVLTCADVPCKNEMSTV